MSTDDNYLDALRMDSDDMLTDEPLWAPLFDEKPSLDEIETLMARLQLQEGDNEGEDKISLCREIIAAGEYVENE